MQKKTKNPSKIPTFKSDEECAEFWDTHSVADYFDEFEAADDVVFVRPKKQVVTLRLERELIQQLKALAQNKGLPYSSLMRMWLIEKVRAEKKNIKTQTLSSV